MSKYSTEKLTWSKVLLFIQSIIAVGTLIWAAAFLRADVNKNTETNQRQDTDIQKHIERVRETYVRKDVAAQRYQNLLDKLEAMDKKLDD